MDAKVWLDIANSVATVVIPLCTLVSVCLLYLSVRETRQLREMQSEPHIVVSAWLKSSGSDLVYMWVENTGYGTAYNVKLSADKLVDSFPYPIHPLAEVGVFKSGIPCFPPRHQLSFYLGELVALRESEFAILEITAAYNGRRRKGYSEVFRIDARSQAGMTDMVERGPLDHIKESIDGVANAIQSRS